ncbi:hypothetical protein WICPIJ_004080 [Wickerhamomyces pijperi]|uniref:Enoyl-CoA hydratase n=1 Tax=Wickerhamomyces pijperi TaxID=599730 RepID=A0A9P8TME4_WICPI|nr:hypothetical protein WICPIJ_004080 [Wickerhamomyces pijperi]
MSQSQIDQLFSTIKHFKITIPIPEIAYIQINRPKKRNCFTSQTWKEYQFIIEKLSTLKLAHDDGDTSNVDVIKVIILSGEGSHFCSGIDISELSQFASVSPKSNNNDHQMSDLKKLKDLESFQNCISTPLRIDIPIIAITHGITYGLALDIIAACQIRLTTKDTQFAIKEIDLGIIADIGSLQRLPGLVNNISVLNELAYTGRGFNGDEALSLGLVSSVFDSKEQAFQYALELAKNMKQKYGPALKGTKKCLDSMTNDTVEVNQGLKQVALDNSQLMSDPNYLKFISKRFKGLVKL